MAGIVHAWILAFMVAAILTGIALVPAVLFGVRVRLGELLEAMCWLTLGVIAIAEFAAAA